MKSLSLFGDVGDTLWELIPSLLTTFLTTFCGDGAVYYLCLKVGHAALARLSPADLIITYSIYQKWERARKCISVMIRSAAIA